MLRNFYALLLCASALTAQAQTPISIVAATDLPAVNDTLRLSTASPVLPAGVPALSLNGANKTWNYAALQPRSQSVDKYTTVPALFQLTFGILGGVNRATLASPQPVPFAIPNLPVTETYAFFNKATADYRSVGYGMVMSGLPVPATYQSQALQDVIYRLPMTYTQRDSSNSVLSGGIPGTLSFNRKQKRVNHVDAWGTLTTPFGTFQTLRVVTTLRRHDSLSLGGIPGQAINQPLTREYKWLAKNQHLPLLTITTQVIAGTETVTGVEYRDIYRRITLPTASRTPAALAGFAVYPNPTTGRAPLHLTGLPETRTVQVTATDLSGRVLFRREVAVSGGSATVPAEAFGTFRGVALLTVDTPAGRAVSRMVRE